MTRSVKLTCSSLNSTLGALLHDSALRNATSDVSGCSRSGIEKMKPVSAVAGFGSAVAFEAMLLYNNNDNSKYWGFA